MGRIGVAVCIAAVIAPCGGPVSRGNKDSNSLGRSGLPQIVILNIVGGAIEEFAEAVAEAHDAGGLIVDDVAGGIVDVVVRRGGGIRSDQHDVGALCDGPGPLNIQRVLDQVVDVAQLGGIGGCADGERLAVAGDDRGLVGGRVSGQPKRAAERGDVGRNDIAGSGDGDGLPGAIDGCACIPQWENVIDSGEVVGRYIFNKIGVSASDVDAKLRPRRCQPGCWILRGIGS